MIKASGRFLAPRAAAATALCMLLGVTAAWALEPNEYRQILGLDSRKLIWFLAQVKLFFAAFVLGVPLFAVIIEYVGWRTNDAKYDNAARPARNDIRGDSVPDRWRRGAERIAEKRQRDRGRNHG